MSYGRNGLTTAMLDYTNRELLPMQEFKQLTGYPNVQTTRHKIANKKNNTRLE